MSGEALFRTGLFGKPARILSGWTACGQFKGPRDHVALRMNDHRVLYTPLDLGVYTLLEQVRNTVWSNCLDNLLTPNLNQRGDQ